MKNIRLRIFILLFFSFNKIGHSQNLVPNSSFEGFTNCPNTPNHIYYADGWFQPHKYPGLYNVNLSSSSDYFNLCNDSTSTVSVPNNFIGHQNPHSGNGYIGIGYYVTQWVGNSFREYAEVKLNQELISNKKYNLKYFVSLADGAWFSTTKFDAFFSNDSLLDTSLYLNLINVIPQISNNFRVNDTLNWTEVKGSFIAQGGERFLTLGNFHDALFCDTLTNNSTSSLCSCSYYYIDDVSLEEDSTTGIDEIDKADFTIYPIPAKSSVQLNSQNIINEIIVTDASSRIVLKFKPFKTNASIDISQLEDGIYFVQCTFKNGKSLSKKIVVLGNKP